ncbi:MAG TPA: hypothetical protein EYH05_09500 [Anaerolineae bacterium]|nr:hypothetical protein [Anaerolineae bacterium]
MMEKPILFNGEMVRAILGGRKTQTRRVINPQPERVDRQGIVHGVDIHSVYSVYGRLAPNGDEHGTWIKCPYGRLPGDQLWVRETWATCWPEDGVKPSHLNKALKIWYKADYRPMIDERGKWRPSIFMPRWVSRIDLRITSIKAERLWQITEHDVRCEGVNVPENIHWADKFIRLWDGINANRGYPWESNPWVWVIEFERIK